MNYAEVGNEDNLGLGGSSYRTRFQLFYDAIKAKYPQMTIMASTIANPLPDDAAGDWHDYSPPDRFIDRFNHFDNLPGGHKYLVGE